MAARQLPKLKTRVRFPSPAPPIFTEAQQGLKIECLAVAQQSLGNKIHIIHLAKADFSFYLIHTEAQQGLKIECLAVVQQTLGNKISIIHSAKADFSFYLINSTNFRQGPNQVLYHNTICYFLSGFLIFLT